MQETMRMEQSFSFSLPMDEKRIDGGKGTMTEIKI